MNRKGTSTTTDRNSTPVETFDARHHESLGLSQRDRSDIVRKSTAQQVGEIYEMAPNDIRVKMLEHLLRSIGVLALVAIANGVFAKLRFRGGWPELKLRVEDIAEVKASDVVCLVDYVLQVNEAVVFGIEKMLRGVEGVDSSDAASVFLANLAQHFCRGSRERWDDFDPVIH